MKPALQGKIWNISAGAGFADMLAHQLLQQHRDISKALILLPNRRSILSLQQAFLQASAGRALLLPRMVALGEIDEKLILRYGNPDAEMIQKLQSLPPAVEEISRHFALADLVMAYQDAKHQPMRFDQAYELAVDLAEMLDELHREGCDFDRFDTLAPEEFAEEWQHILHFLRIIREYWPALLQEQGRVDPWVRRNRIVAMAVRCWQLQAPDFPVIIAGTTGSIPAVAELVNAVLQLPQGSIFLPALDEDAPEATLTELDAGHPQKGLQSLLEHLGVPREDITSLSNEPNARRRWLSQSFLPAEYVELWRHEKPTTEAALQGCHYIPCEDMRQEALVIAALLREALEVPHKTAALVTTDRTLARQVRAQMLRWGVVLDDSAGTPLHHSPAGNFLLLLLEAVKENFSAVSLLALMKHPLSRLGREPAEIRSLIRAIEKKALRGIQPAGLLALSHRITDNQKAKILLDEMINAVVPLQEIIAAAEAMETPEHSMPEILNALQAAAEAMTRDTEGTILLWRGEEGKALANLFAAMMSAGQETALSLYEFTLLLRNLLAREVTRYQWQQHPRLQILSPMEARMLRVNRIILGGLNEGSWPTKTQAEPWLNRPMRVALGLPLPEYQTGLLAHDFYQLVAMPEVFLTRAAKEGGAVTVPSRFLQRMQAVLEISGGGAAVKQWKDYPVIEWVKQMEESMATLPPLQPPAPCPPVSARPKRFSATGLETLLRNPYAIYAKQILKLKKQEPLGLMPEAREFGNAVHDALEAFALAKGWQNKNPLNLLHQKGREAFQPYTQLSPVIEALWWPRFLRIAEWVLAQGWPEQMLTEQEGVWQLGEYTLTARLDRMDISTGGYKIIDYKTGTPPSKKQIALGLGVQLTLAAAMVEEGCFGESLAQKSVDELTYWVLKGGMKGGEEVTIDSQKAQQLIADLKTKLPQLLKEYDSPDKSYLATPDKRAMLKYNDYEHLERMAEWGGV